MFRLYIKTLCVAPLLLLCCLGAKGQKIDEQGCEEWIKGLNRTIESIPMEKRRDKIMEHVGSSSCQLLSSNISSSALGRTGNDKAVGIQFLAKAGEPYFSSICFLHDIELKAYTLPHICLNGDFPTGPRSNLLKSISAFDYLFGRILEREFSVFTDESSPVSERVILNYFLSATILGECPGLECFL